MFWSLMVVCGLPSTAAASADDDGGGVGESLDPDRKPDAPAPDVAAPQRAKAYAGVGSGVAYASQGVAELGGSLGFSASPGLATFSADPMVGYFVLDNLELSAIAGARHTSVEGETTNRFTLLAEPSVHLPFNDGVFWVGGLGLGAALTDGLQEGRVTGGFALAPRTGVQVLIGRSGILNLGVRYAMVLWGLEADVEPATGQAVIDFANTFDAQVGYTVMF